jgi:hypothetical protein
MTTLIPDIEQNTLQEIQLIENTQPVILITNVENPSFVINITDLELNRTKTFKIGLILFIVYIFYMLTHI